MRIWYQSCVDPAKQRDYLDQLGRYLTSIAGPEVTIDLFGIAPAQLSYDPVTHLRCAVQVLQNAIHAERAGYDAFVIGNFPEPGLAECASAVDIPVVGLAQATLSHAAMLGGKIGLITVTPAFIPWHEQQIAQYGLADRVVGIQTLPGSVSDVVAAYSDPDRYACALAAYRERSGRLVAAGAEVIVTAGGAAMSLFANERDFQVGDAIVLNGIPVAIALAETRVRLRRLNGTGVSRAGRHAKASAEAIHQFLAVMGESAPRPAR